MNFSDEEILKDVLADVAAERAKYGKKEDFPAQNQELEKILTWRGVGRFLENEPQKAEYIFKDYLRTNTVGAIFAAGGTGKTFLIIELAAALATGKPFGLFKPEKPRKVLFLAGEEDENILHERSKAIFQYMGCTGNDDMGDHHRQLLKKNLEIISLRGIKEKFFLEYGPSGNVQKTKFFYALKDAIQKIGGIEVLFIDPLSRFYGLDENSSSDANCWVSALEELSKDLGLTVLYSHHENKTQATGKGDIKDSFGRGSTAFRDGIRWSISLAGMNHSEAEQFGVDERNYVVADITKANHTKKLPSKLYFKRHEDTGVLDPVNLKEDKSNKLINTLLTQLAGSEHEFTEKEIIHDSKDKTRNKAAKEIFESIKKEIPGIKRTVDLGRAIESAIFRGRLIATEKLSGKTFKKVLVIPDHHKAEYEQVFNTLQAECGVLDDELETGSPEMQENVIEKTLEISKNVNGRERSKKNVSTVKQA